jgi:hypothetical protein
MLWAHVSSKRKRKSAKENRGDQSQRGSLPLWQIMVKVGGFARRGRRGWGGGDGKREGEET